MEIGTFFSYLALSVLKLTAFWAVGVQHTLLSLDELKPIGVLHATLAICDKLKHMLTVSALQVVTNSADAAASSGREKADHPLPIVAAWLQ